MQAASITVSRSRKALSSSGKYTFHCGTGRPVTFCLQVRTANMIKPQTCHQLQGAPDVRLVVPSVISSSNTSASLTCTVLANPAPTNLTWTLCQRGETCIRVVDNVTATQPATNLSFTSHLPLSLHLHRLPGDHLHVTCLASNSLGEGSATSPLTLVDYLPPLPVLITWCLCFACSDCRDSTQFEEDVTLTAFSSQKLKAQCSALRRGCASGGQDEGWILSGSLSERQITRRSWSTNRSHTHIILIDKLAPQHTGILHCHGFSLKLNVIGKEDILFSTSKAGSRPAMRISFRRLSKIWVTAITRSVEKILVTQKMLQPPPTLVPNFPGNEQLSNHVCHDIGISYSFARNQGFSPIFPLKTANFR